MSDINELKRQAQEGELHVKQIIEALDDLQRLRECMRIAGLQCFMRGASPVDVAEHMQRISESWTQIEKDNVALKQRVSDLKFALGDGAGWFDRAMAYKRQLELVEAVTRRGPRFSDVHMESAADSVIEEVKQALKGEGV